MAKSDADPTQQARMIELMLAYFLGPPSAMLGKH